MTPFPFPGQCVEFGQLRVLGVVFLRDLDPNTWPGVREVSKDSDEFRSQKDARLCIALVPKLPGVKREQTRSALIKSWYSKKIRLATRDHFMASCEPWKHKYDFDLSVDKLYSFLAQCIKIINIINCSSGSWSTLCRYIGRRGIDRPPATPAAPAQSLDHKFDTQQLAKAKHGIIPNINPYYIILYIYITVYIYIQTPSV